MALDGQLTSIDDADTRCVLGTYDCVYIPPHARHQNSNASDREVTFAVVGSPANITHSA
jgi:uncharacterized RmlC-like cupin family protein